MRIIFATTNEEKIREAEVALKPFGIQVEGRRFSFQEPCEGTMEEIAKIKLSQIKVTDEQTPIIVDDSGIIFEAYPKFPGVLSRRFFSLLGYKGISKLLENENRAASFYGVIAIRWKDKVEIFAGETKGRIIKKIPEHIPPNLKFPFDPIFIPEGSEQVLGDLTLEKRVEYSYRRKALAEVGNWITNNLQQ